jgi:hypothetical protein
MSDVGNIIRLFGTAVGAVVGAFVPPAGVAIAAVANVGAAAYDISVGQTPASDGKPVKIENFAKDLETATAAVPKASGSKTPSKDPPATDGKHKIDVAAPPVKIVEPTDEAESTDESTSEPPAPTTPATEGDAHDALIRSLRETTDEPPDTQSLVRDRNPVTQVAEFAID